MGRAPAAFDPVDDRVCHHWSDLHPLGPDDPRPAAQPFRQHRGAISLGPIGADGGDNWRLPDRSPLWHLLPYVRVCGVDPQSVLWGAGLYPTVGRQYPDHDGDLSAPDIWHQWP